MKVAWNPNLYDDKHDFVFKFGEEIVSLLNPQKDEVILDLGSGTGDLTKQIAENSQQVIGLDNSAEMVLKAQQKHPNIAFVQADARSFQLDTIFDAVFSNATLHWIPDAESVIKTISQHLKTGGRFVAEFGGKGCVYNIISTLSAVLDEKKVEYPLIDSVLYYPSVGEYSQILEKNGFELAYGALFDRPTDLKDGYNGVANWIEMFLHWMLKNVDESERELIKNEVSQRLAPKMYDGAKWVADYRRIRIVAIKK